MVAVKVICRTALVIAKLLKDKHYVPTGSGSNVVIFACLCLYEWDFVVTGMPDVS